MASVSLWCLILGEIPPKKHVFLTDATLNESIDSIRDRIIAKRSPKLSLIDPVDISLYIPKIPPTFPTSTASEDIFNKSLSQLNPHNLGANTSFDVLLPTNQVGDHGLLAQPPEGHLHILVVLPLQCPLKRLRTSDEVIDVIERWRSKRVKTELPTSLAELKRLVESPLSEDEKIPLAADRMKDLVSSNNETFDICTNDHINLLFRVSQTHSTLDRFFFTILQGPPPGGNENIFISFWDANIREILELLVPHGKSTRNSNVHTATEALRPDYAFLLDKLCPFRGEEKPPDSSGNPKVGLAEKFDWVYTPAPYIFGYYTTGPDFTLAAITPPSHHGGQPVVHDLAHADLRLKRDRIKNICRLINISGLFKTIANLVQPPDAEFEALARDDCTVELTGRNIVKKYTCLDKGKRVENVRNVYRLLQTKGVPGTDSLVHSFDATVILSPRGVCKTPETEQGLLDALTCVLETLEVLHDAPSLFHRDIRWPNIIQRLDVPHVWFLVDWEDAAAPPTKAQPRFDKTDHSPGCFSDGHGAEVDLWSVGQLIYRSNAVGISSELRELGKWMQGSATPSVREALEKVTAYYSSHY